MVRLNVCSTAGCGQLTPGNKCSRHASEPERRRNAEQRKPYFTSRWARLREIVLRRDNYLCQECLRQGRTSLGDQVDHIAKAATNPDDFWAMENLQTLCPTCHSQKTRRGE